MDLAAAALENNEKNIAQSQKIIMDISTFPYTSRSYNGLYNAMEQYIAEYNNFKESPLSLLLNPFYERSNKQTIESRSDSSSESSESASSEDASAPSSSSSAVDIIFLFTFKGRESFSIICTGYEFIQLSKNLLELFIKSGNLSGIQWLLPKILLLDKLNLSSQHLEMILAPLERTSCSTKIDVLARTAIGLLNEVGTIEPITQVIELWKDSLRTCKEQGLDIAPRLNEIFKITGLDSKQLEEVLYIYGIQ